MLHHYIVKYARLARRVKQTTKWHERFMDVANLVSSWSTCRRRQCGAVVVRNKRIISTGYNGAPVGILECTSGRECLREKLQIPSGEQLNLCVAVHAEANAIAQAACFGISLKDASIYITNQPCISCSKLIINAGIVNIYYRGDYPDKLSLDLLSESGVTVTII